MARSFRFVMTANYSHTGITIIHQNVLDSQTFFPYDDRGRQYISSIVLDTVQIGEFMPQTLNAPRAGDL